MASQEPIYSSRRRFVAQSLTLMAGAMTVSVTPHVCLLGDSIFDNKSYVGSHPDVIEQVRDVLPAGWKASLLAVDGATTAGIRSQLAKMPSDASHLVLSIGGNDALGRAHILSSPARTTGDALAKLSVVVREFDSAYRDVVAKCLAPGLPLTICTIYNGNFPDADYQRQVNIALAAFNDVIIRTAAERRLTVLELRQICSEPEDYANPIEPSSIGGAKIAKAIMRAVTERTAPLRGAHLVSS